MVVWVWVWVWVSNGPASHHITSLQVCSGEQAKDKPGGDVPGKALYHVVWWAPLPESHGRDAVGCMPTGTSGHEIDANAAADDDKSRPVGSRHLPSICQLRVGCPGNRAAIPGALCMRVLAVVPVVELGAGADLL